MLRIWTKLFCALLLLPFAGALSAQDATAYPAGNTGAFWQWSGWGGGGYFWSCAVDPSNPQVIYLGGDVNGVCKSTDQGKTWNFINRGINDYEINSLVVDPQDTRIVYAFTGGGICKSTDGGENWRALPQTEKKEKKITSHRSTTIRAIAIDGADHNLIYAGTPEGKVFQSPDGGENWTELSLPAAEENEKPAFSGTGCLLLKTKFTGGSWDRFGRAEKVYGDQPKDWSAFGKLTAALFAPAGAPKLEAQLVVQCGAGWIWQQGEFAPLQAGAWTPVALDLSKLKDMQQVRAVYVIVRSTAAGFEGEIKLDAVRLLPVSGDSEQMVADWEKPDEVDGWKAHKQDAKYTQISGVVHSSKPAVSAIVGIATASKTPGTVYVSTAAHGLFKSTDAGKQWQRLKTPLSGQTITVDNNDNRVVYAALAANGVWKSADAGATWEKTALRVPDKGKVIDVAVARGNSQKLYAITREGWNGQLCHSDDAGATWNAVAAFKADHVANPTQPQEVRSNGLTTLSSVTNIAILDAAGEQAFVSANWCNVMTTDGGKTLVESARGADISCIHDIQFHNGVVYACAMDEGLLASDDQGATWRQLTPLKYIGELSGHCWRVNVSGPKGKERIIASFSPWNAYLPNYIALSNDGGKTFNPVHAGLPTYRSMKNCMWGVSYGRALAADPKNPSTLYLGLDGDAEPGKTGAGLFKSTDGGQNWLQLPAQPASRRMFYGLVVDPTDSNRLFWGACNVEGGVHRSEDGGATWKKVFANDTWIFDLMITADGTIYAAGKNLWRSRDHGNTWQQVTKRDNSQTVVALACDPENPKRLWYSSLVWSNTAIGGVFESVDDGASWTEITNTKGFVKPLILRYNSETKELWAGGVALFKIKR